MAVAAAFLSWALLLPVVPLGVLTSGGSDALAGSTTAIFMGCSVLTQWNTPRALRRFGYTPVMVFAAIMLGVPALGHITLDDAPFVLTLSAFRGIGFGALTVAESALVAELVPKRFLGRASGLLGLAIGLAQLVGLPLGVWLATEYSFASAYILGAVVGLLAAVACIFIPWIVAEGGGSGSDDSIPWRAVVVPCVGITTVAMGFGAVSSFLPAASSSGVVAGLILAVVGGAQMIARYLAGVIADRMGGPGLLLIPSLACGVAGLVVVSLALLLGWPAWVLLVGALVFGSGFGAIQNETLLLLFGALPRTRLSDGSAIWNMAFDGGTGVGSLILGVVAVRVAYPETFVVATFLVAVGLAIVWARVFPRIDLRQVDPPRKA